jgi:hypothetical protein
MIIVLVEDQTRKNLFKFECISEEGNVVDSHSSGFVNSLVVDELDKSIWIS